MRAAGSLTLTKPWLGCCSGVILYTGQLIENKYDIRGLTCSTTGKRRSQGSSSISMGSVSLLSFDNQKDATLTKRSPRILESHMLHMALCTTGSTSLGRGTVTRGDGIWAGREGSSSPSSLKTVWTMTSPGFSIAKNWCCEWWSSRRFGVEIHSSHIS